MSRIWVEVLYDPVLYKSKRKKKKIEKEEKEEKRRKKKKKIKKKKTPSHKIALLSLKKIVKDIDIHCPGDGPDSS